MTHHLFYMCKPPPALHLKLATRINTAKKVRIMLLYIGFWSLRGGQRIVRQVYRSGRGTCVPPFH